MSGKVIKNQTFYNIRWQYLICLVLVVSILAAYIQVRHFDFLVYDDDLYVTDNPVVKSGLNQKSLIWAFKSNHAANWHPLTWLSHMLDVQLYGLNAGAHHLVNLLFHILNSILLFLAFGQITGTLWRSAAVAAFFALHPLHVESVVWIAERKDVLSAFFWLLTIMSYGWYVKRPCACRYLSVLVSFTLGLMVKPMVVTLPLVLLLLDYWPLGRIGFNRPDPEKEGRTQRKIFFRLVMEKAPLFILTVAACTATIIVQSKGGALESFVRYPFAVRVTNAVVSYALYILKMIWPSRLSVYYPHPGMWPFLQVAGAILSLAVIFIYVVKTHKEKPYLLVGWLWFIGTLVPVIGLVQVGSQAMADRYTYIPLIGLFIMIAWGAEELLQRWRIAKFYLAAAGAALMLILTMVSWRQISYWQDSIKLFQHAVMVTTDNLTAHNNLGIALFRKGDAAKAVYHYLIVLNKDPHNFRIHNNLGNALFSLGKVNEAKTHYYRALQLNPNHASAHNNLANILTAAGNESEAFQHYLKAIEINPEYTDAHYNLGNSLVKQARFNEAVDRYLTVLKNDPYHSAAQRNLSIALAKQYPINDARNDFSEAIVLKPEDVSIQKTNTEKKKIEKWIAEIQVLLNKKPYDPEVHVIIGNLYIGMGDFDSSKAYYQKAILIEPEFAEAFRKIAAIQTIR